MRENCGGFAGAQGEFLGRGGELRVAGGAGAGLDGPVMRWLEWWPDEVVRDGFENMAVDDWLLETAEHPVLRIYRWAEGWGSFGYFVADRDAARALPGLRRVRRRTGGGIVDHRADWTYTLVVPAGGELASLRGGSSYRVIHAALAAALREGGLSVALAPELGPARGGVCFVRPVEYDLLDAAGRKVAGAGQRRSSRGLLHQGSVALDVDRGLGERLVGHLAERFGAFGGRVDAAEIAARAARYRAPDWLGRR